MKSTANILLALFAITFIFVGCQKSQLQTPARNTKPQSLKLATTLKLTASQLTVGRDTADTLTITGLSKRDSVKWAITPPGYSNIIQQSASRLIVSFTTAGIYSVKAVVNSKDTLAASIKVDTVGSISPQSNIPFQSGDQIIITPSVYKGATPDSVGIMFSAHTADTYNCLNSTIHASWSDTNNNFNIKYMDVVQPNGGWCMVGSRVLSLNSFFPQNPANPYMVPGTYPLTIVFGTTTYSGKIIISSSSIKFDWNYTSGVTFATKQISR